MIRIALFLLLALGTSLPAIAQEWVRYRGPNGSGHSDCTTIPTEWTEEDYNWMAELPGIGHSSPVIWGDRLFISSADPESAERYFICLDANTGQTLWTRSFEATPSHLHLQNSYASSSPTVDAERVYVAWGSPESTTLMAMNHAGETAWSLELGPYISLHGFAVSPMLYEDAVILASQQQGEIEGNRNPGDSFIVAVDQESGEIRWKTERESKSASYAIPCVYTYPDGREELICCSLAHGMYALDPETGEENWADKVFRRRTVSSPYVVGDVVFGSCGSGGGGNYVVAMRPGDPPEELYRHTSQAPYVPMGVAHGDYLFLWSDAGIVTCLAQEDGEVQWRERVGGNFSGSPVCVGGAIYCIDIEGVVSVIRATPEYEWIARNPLGAPSRATPAVAGGQMFLRTESHIMAIGGE